MRDHLVAVDVGTASARAGLFDRSGRLLARAVHPVTLIRSGADLAEHDSDDIWQAVVASVRAAVSEAGIDRQRIAAIGFDGTCSLVFTGSGGQRLSVARNGAPGLDTICWMDHRAIAEAEELSAAGDAALNLRGRCLSPEMALPKLLWVKRHRPDVWNGAGAIFDLADFLTFRATGSNRRSRSTLSAKWAYRQGAGPDPWPTPLLKTVGLHDLAERAGITGDALLPGAPLAPLSASAAAELDLDTGCVVASGMVDAFAGTLALLGRYGDNRGALERNAALVAGTSTCIIRLSAPDSPPLPGFWGPYGDVCLPDHALTEGGQSAAGGLLDHVVTMHAAGGKPTAELHRRIVEQIERELQLHGADYGQPIDVYPDFLGNRSPLADPRPGGLVAGLSLDSSFEGLCKLYWRTAVGLACGLRQVLDAYRTEAGFKPDTLHIGGGHGLNSLLVRLYADVTGKRIAVPALNESMLLGSAINAATAAGLYPDLVTAASAMSGPGSIIEPDPERHAAFGKDYARHRLMARHMAELRSLY